jgi:amidohydrolase
MTNDASALKEFTSAHVDALAEELSYAWRTIWENPEIGLQERKASALLADTLSRHGLNVERGIAGLETAFRSDFGSTGPRIAILAEYDALPGIGHGCGHNIIATSALGASLALAALGDRLPGSIRLLGTPAEESAVEGAGGKVPVAREGHFSGADAAIMIHPGGRTMAALRPSLAARSMKVEFHGKAAHAAGAPHEGINALDAVLLTFNGINALRQQVRSDVRIHGVITHGGEAPNVIPPYTAARIRCRARDAEYLAELYERVLACAEGAAKATGCRLEWTEDVYPYHNTVANHAIGELLERNLTALGLSIDQLDENSGGGSTDFGNVSHTLPSCHAGLAICPPNTPGHSNAMREAAGSPAGLKAALDGAKLLAHTAIDLMTDGVTLEQAKAEFAKAEGLMPA